MLKELGIFQSAIPLETIKRLPGTSKIVFHGHVNTEGFLEFKKKGEARERDFYVEVGGVCLQTSYAISSEITWESNENVTLLFMTEPYGKGNKSYLNPDRVYPVLDKNKYVSEQSGNKGSLSIERYERLFVYASKACKVVLQIKCNLQVETLNPIAPLYIAIEGKQIAVVKNEVANGLVDYKVTRPFEKLAKMIRLENESMSRLNPLLAGLSNSSALRADSIKPRFKIYENVLLGKQSRTEDIWVSATAKAVDEMDNSAPFLYITNKGESTENVEYVYILIWSKTTVPLEFTILNHQKKKVEAYQDQTLPRLNDEIMKWLFRIPGKLCPAYFKFQTTSSIDPKILRSLSFNMIITFDQTDILSADTGKPKIFVLDDLGEEKEIVINEGPYYRILLVGGGGGGAGFLTGYKVYSVGGAGGGRGYVYTYDLGYLDNSLKLKYKIGNGGELGGYEGGTSGGDITVRILGTDKEYRANGGEPGRCENGGSRGGAGGTAFKPPNTDYDFDLPRIRVGNGGPSEIGQGDPPGIGDYLIRQGGKGPSVKFPGVVGAGDGSVGHGSVGRVNGFSGGGAGGIVVRKGPDNVVHYGFGGKGSSLYNKGENGGQGCIVIVSAINETIANRLIK